MSDMSDHRSGFGATPGQTGSVTPGRTGSVTPGQTGSVTEQATTLARDLKDQASSAVGQATRQMKDQVSAATDAAKGLASQAGDKLRSAAEEQKTAGADFVGGMAGAIRRAANEFDREMPQAADYIRRAAEQVDSVSEALRRRDLSELVGGVQDFARRQPTAFLGATVLAGFAAVRFLKSSTGTRPSTASGDPLSEFRSSPGTGMYGGGSSSPSDFGRPTANAGAGGLMQNTSPGARSGSSGDWPRSPSGAATQAGSPSQGSTAWQSPKPGGFGPNG